MFASSGDATAPLAYPRRDIHFDHEIPLWNGSEDSEDNLRALKKKHHLLKTCREAGDRAKMHRIIERDGMRKRRARTGSARCSTRYLEQALSNDPIRVTVHSLVHTGGRPIIATGASWDEARDKLFDRPTEKAE